MLFPVRAGVQVEVGAPQIGLSSGCRQTQLKAAFEMNESRTDPAFADIPYPEPPKARFEKETFLIPGGICQIHGVVPHYLYLALRTTGPDRALLVHKILQFRAGVLGRNQDIVQTTFSLLAVATL